MYYSTWNKKHWNKYVHYIIKKIYHYTGTFQRPKLYLERITDHLKRCQSVIRWNTSNPEGGSRQPRRSQTQRRWPEVVIFLPCAQSFPNSDSRGRSKYKAGRGKWKWRRQRVVVFSCCCVPAAPVSSGATQCTGAAPLKLSVFKFHLLTFGISVNICAALKLWYFGVCGYDTESANGSVWF